MQTTNEQTMLDYIKDITLSSGELLCNAPPVAFSEEEERMIRHDKPSLKSVYV